MIRQHFKFSNPPVNGSDQIERPGALPVAARTAWSWKPPAATRAAIRRGDVQYRQWQRLTYEQLAAARRARRVQQS